MARSTGNGRANRRTCSNNTRFRLVRPIWHTSSHHHLGRQFESTLFAELNLLLGVDHFRTTPRHPQSNGIVERFHRTLKAAITCRGSSDWFSELPIVLLGLRSAFKEDIQASPAEMLYGTTIRLPGEFFVESSKPYTTDFVTSLKQNMRDLRPTATAHHTSNIYSQQTLQKQFTSVLHFLADIFLVYKRRETLFYSSLLLI